MCCGLKLRLTCVTRMLQLVRVHDVRRSQVCLGSLLTQHAQWQLSGGGAWPGNVPQRASLVQDLRPMVRDEPGSGGWSLSGRPAHSLKNSEVGWGLCRGALNLRTLLSFLTLMFIICSVDHFFLKLPTADTKYLCPGAPALSRLFHSW